PAEGSGWRRERRRPGPRRTDMRRLIAILGTIAALSGLAGCGSEDAGRTGTQPGTQTGAEPDGDGQGGPAASEPAVESVTLTRAGGVAGVQEAWKIGPTDPGLRRVFEAASREALDEVEAGDGHAGKPPCCDFFQYDLVVRYEDGTNATYRVWDGG